MEDEDEDARSRRNASYQVSLKIPVPCQMVEFLLVHVFFLIIDFAAGGQICLFFKNIFKCIFIHYTGQKKNPQTTSGTFLFLLCKYDTNKCEVSDYLPWNSCHWDTI